MSKIIRWETPFTDSFYPSVLMLSIPATPSSLSTNQVKIIVELNEKNFKYLVDFGEVLAFTCMEESCCPERDLSSATFDKNITKDKSVCAFQWLNSPWLKSYEGCHDPESTVKFSHYLVFGGDNNVEVITKHIPTIKKIEEPESIKFEFNL